VDLIGPLNATSHNKKKLVLNALTMIDPATGWFEIAEAKERTAEHVAKVFDNAWLSRYPRPQYIGFDNGGENKGLVREMVENYGQRMKPTSTHNPQSNGIIERVHAVINDMLRTHKIEETDVDETDPWTDILSATAFAIRSTCHTVLEATPAQLVFRRDMILPIKFQADWAYIRRQKAKAIAKNNDRENDGRIAHTYKVGDKVLYRKHGILRKLDIPRRGPYQITKVYNNGTVKLKRGVVSERVNIRHLTPFFE
jgi:hypothetical protein